MQYFEDAEGKLVFRENGEVVQVEAWGEDSVRVRSRFLGDILEETCGALTEEPVVKQGTVEIVDEWNASFTNGRMKVHMYVNGWGNALQMTFFNEKGEVLLREISNGGALCRKARYYRALSGGSFQAKVTFEANPEEKIYGMGQYQQERMNLKGCNLELAHRNSQASVPFYVSSLGYGFLWNNPAVGEVHFGTNTTEWEAWSTDQLDYWITAGDRPADIERNYAAATGHAPMMPEFGLGFWQCKLRYYNQQQVLDVAAESVVFHWM